VTEAEWLACNDPRLQLVYLEGKASERKARLLACGVGRCLWPYLGDERSRRVVELAEKHADGLISETELAAARGAAHDANRGAASRTASWVGNHHPWQAARVTIIMIQQAQTDVAAKDWSSRVAARSRGLIHCVFGNPFRHATLNPSWLAWNCGTVTKLGQAIYEEKAFDRLPILADALEEAGCHDQGILGHCRSRGEHVRGCWVVDLLLGKE
jgi:hypothetical protein